MADLQASVVNNKVALEVHSKEDSVDRREVLAGTMEEADITRVATEDLEVAWEVRREVWMVDREVTEEDRLVGRAVDLVDLRGGGEFDTAVTICYAL